ncbi:MAG: calcium/sodium antiporter [Lachnospiraceae bacterium]|nr:calcium/sodium antiporter [Lachnospiraceae bacterium]
MMYLLLLVGFALLVKGADMFVDGSSSIAGILKVPSLIIGLTIVAMGTSAPEASVSITAGLAGNADISLGNVVGSNIFNVLFVVGLCAVIFPAETPKDIMKRDVWWNIAASIGLLLLILDKKLSRLDGVILLVAFVTYIGLMIRSALKNRVEGDSQETMSVPKSIIFAILGLAMIILGGNLVVDNASKIAIAWGMSEALVGLTIVAIGTSLPELVTSVTASKKGDSGISLGNAVGSDLFNIMFILGIASVLAPITVAPELIIDTIIMIAVTVLITIFCKTSTKINRVEGIIMLVGYIVYTAYIIMR